MKSLKPTEEAPHLVTRRSWMRRILTFIARVIALGGIGFISIFALDVFTPGAPVATVLLALFMHLLPSLALLGILALAWRWPLPGGLLFLVVAAAFMLLLNNPFWVNAMLAGPFAIAGLLFLLGDRGSFDR